MPPRRAGPARSPASPPSVKLTSPIVKKAVGGRVSALQSVKPAKAFLIEKPPQNYDVVQQYMKANEAQIWLEEEIESRTLQSRLDQGEIFPEGNSSSDEVDEEFDINACEEACGVTPGEILDFVWFFAPSVQFKFKSKRQLDYVLSCEPKDLLRFLGLALDEAALEIGPEIP